MNQEPDNEKASLHSISEYVIGSHFKKNIRWEVLFYKSRFGLQHLGFQLGNHIQTGLIQGAELSMF